jgi:hypothetical protein
MQIPFSPSRPARSGFALIVVLTFLVVSLVVFASVMYWVSTNSKITQRNIVFNQSQAAAESACEFIISSMMRDFNTLCLNSSNSYNNLVFPTNNWPISYMFSATNGASGLTAFVSIGPTNWGAVPSQFTGLSGLGQNCVIACTATPQNQVVNVPATVVESIWFGTIPVFQYAVFYNVVLEINPGGAMTISGRVHCNTNIYCTGNSSSQPLTFVSTVEAAGMITNRSSPLDPRSPARTGNVVFPAGSPIQNYDALHLPLGTSTTNYSYDAIEALLKLPPTAYAMGTADAYSTNGMVYFANRADLIITNDPATGTNITVLYQNQNDTANYLTVVKPDAIGGVVTNKIITTNGTTIKTYTTNYVYTTNYYYSFVTNDTFYDYRENDTVRALQIDVSKLTAWLANTDPTRGGQQYEQKNAGGGSTDKGAVINSVYVYNSLPRNNTNLPAVRLVNGEQLPTNSYGSYQSSGLGIATAQPIYVQGDYNTTRDRANYARTLGSTTNGCTLPACLLGDAITVLSSGFTDNPSGGTLNPTPSQSTIVLNAACFEGIVPSNGSYYSGGLENFLRLLENWNSKTVVYNGSIVVMFPSYYATNHYDGSVYGVPGTRAWGFDTTFTQPGKLPPLCPNIKADARAAWSFGQQ